MKALCSAMKAMLYSSWEFSSYEKHLKSRPGGLCKKFLRAHTASYVLDGLSAPTHILICCSSLKMSLRQRYLSTDNATDEKQNRASHVDTSRASATNPSPLKASGRQSFAIFVALVLSTFLCLAFQFLDPLSNLLSASPNAYILCSQDSNAIYTVDEKNSKIQCIAVQGSYIVGTGALRKSFKKLCDEIFA